jgi:hypothetical protein
MKTLVFGRSFSSFAGDKMSANL